MRQRRCHVAGATPLQLVAVAVLLAAATAAGGTVVGRCTTSTALRTYAKCIALPTQGATLAWTYDARNATLDAAFTGSFISPSGWVAWGVNRDAPAMTGARVVAAFSDPSTGALLALPFVLSPDVKLQASPLVSRPLDIPLLASSASLVGSARTVRDGATVTIAATIRLSPNRTKLHFVWNRGLYVQGYSPAIHPTDASDLASHATVDILTTATEASPTASAALQWAHGSLNALSWGFLLPMGAAVARYLRPCASTGPAWFYAHAAVQATGYALGAAGFALGLVMGSASPGVTYKLHRGLGVAAATAGSLQTLAMLFRPKTTNRYRKYWKSYHHLVGYGCVVVGVVNVFQGFEVMGLGASYWKLGYCMAMATLVGGCVALEVNAWVVFCRRQQEEKLMRREVEDVVVVKDRAAAF
ncbi:cytochrome b561 and DOMON domain-containing protein At2g04850 [Oryza brachyantha]|uniref:cytochrome b561 and DOMON domain-containing protein At2g04850 n=1 Tax=Oryza brachyantha TaxID=4533 RepID=UPI001ADA4A62|nr:cytochrome b561 and DOMON domain-containing protein At2g04850 [Oryza brachyantha]